MDNQFLYEFGTGFLTGFVVMYAFKKFVKFFFLIVGLYILSLFYLTYIGLIDINLQGIDTILLSLAQRFQNSPRNCSW